MGKNTNRALIELFLHLEQMEKAGVPLRQSLEAARDDADNTAVKKRLLFMAEDLRAGRTLSEAMAQHPRFFDAAVVRLIAAGEKSGRLARVFETCRNHVKRAEDHARKMRAALRYPKIAGVIILGLAVIRNHSEMPVIAAVVYGGWLLFWLLRRYSATFKYWTDKMFLGIPIVGRVVKADSWARYASALALMFEAGIPLREALAAAAGCVPNLGVREAAENAVPRVVAGAPLYQAFADGAHVDRMMLSMLKAGEVSGNLAHTLGEVADWNDKRTDDALTSLHQTAGPFMTLVLGALVFYVFEIR